MSSKREHEGYIVVDHREGPGLSDEFLAKHKLPPGSGKGLWESATYTCSHCQKVVILNPDRSRPKGYCRKCDHYICDECHAQLFLTGVCYPFKARVADVGSKV